MLGLPKSTECTERIPMQRFYKRLSGKPAIKKVFTKQIRVIYCRNKLMASTLKLAPGKQATEIAVLEVKLTTPKIEDNILHLIDSKLFCYVLFLLRYAGKYQVVIGTQECKNSHYYRTPWLAEKELTLYLDGLTIDELYQNFVRQIADNALDDDTDTAQRLSDKLQKQRKRLIEHITSLVAKLKDDKRKQKMQRKKKCKRSQSKIPKSKKVVGYATDK